MAGTDAAYGPWLLVVGFVVIVAGVGRLAAFRTGWDTPAPDEPRGPVTSPPEPLRAPAIAGRLATRRSTGALGAATLIDLAERGIVRCSEATGAARWLGRSFTLHLLTEPAGLLSHERALLDLAFGPAPRKTAAKMATVQRLLTSHTIRFGRALNDDMRQMRLVDGDRLAARRSLVVVALLLLAGTILSAGAAFMLADEFGGWSIALPVSVAVVALSCAGMAASFSVLTLQGSREAREWRAFAAHMKATTARQADRTAVVPRQWLPLALAAGLGPQWAKRMVATGRSHSIPTWFVPADAGGASGDGFLALIDTCSNKTGQPHNASGTSHGTNEALGAIAGG